MTRLRRRASRAPLLPDNDDVVTEILLRLPAQPSSLPRAGLVCKRWRRLVTDPHFIRRFRAHHRTPPLLGFFRPYTYRFLRAMEAEKCLPTSNFSLRRWCPHMSVLNWRLVDCRNGLVLYVFCGTVGRNKEFLVANPVTGHRKRVLYTERDGVVAAAIVAAESDIFRCSFRLVALFSLDYAEKIYVSVYSSDSGTWSHSVATLLLPFFSNVIYTPNIMSRNAIYWLHQDGVIIRFDLETYSLSMIEHPPVEVVDFLLTRQMVTMGDDGRFGFAFLSELSIQLWEREEEEVDNGAGKWVLTKTVQLDKFIPLRLKKHVKALGLTGFAEECNVIFVCTRDGVFAVHLETMKFSKVYGRPVFKTIHPYTSF